MAEKLKDYMEGVMTGGTSDDFFYYEPWDPAEDEILIPEREWANGFQKAYHNCSERIRVLPAANRTGKTQCMAVEAIIMMTGCIPICMKYDEGEITDIPRPWKEDGDQSPGALNRLRWGFKNPNTGEWTPPVHYPDTLEPDWPKHAPCGFIVGAGKFPVEKICRNKGDQVWICTYHQTKETRWVPLLSALIPKQFLNTVYRQDGYSDKRSQFMLTNGNSISLISYEKGADRVQGAGIFAIFFDEEPKDRKYWTEGDQRLIKAGHDGWMTMGFTPLNGLSWSYTDLFKPALEKKTTGITLFHANQYQSPYIAEASVNSRKANYKPYEIQARVYGRYTEMEGRPFYDYVKLNGTENKTGWVQRFVPRFNPYRLAPLAFEPRILEDLLDGQIVLEATDQRALASSDNDCVWEFYEDIPVNGPVTDDTFFLVCDTAEGSENEDEAHDRNVAYIMRPPHKHEDQLFAVVVAALRTSIPVIPFAREVWMAAQFFNYCLIAPEVKGTSGGSLISELRDYPFLYQCTVMNDQTKRATNKLGFDTTVKNRKTLFDLVGDYIDANSNPQCMKHYWLLHEAAQCIFGRNGRPDHPKRGTSDCLVTFGIGQYIFRYDRMQITDNRSFGAKLNKREKRRSIFDIYLERDATDRIRARCLGSKNRTGTQSAARRDF